MLSVNACLKCRSPLQYAKFHDLTIQPTSSCRVALTTDVLLNFERKINKIRTIRNVFPRWLVSPGQNFVFEILLKLPNRVGGPNEADATAVIHVNGTLPKKRAANF